MKLAFTLFFILQGSCLGLASENIDSLFTGSWSWQDSDQKKFLFENLPKENIVVTMIYSECKKTCPMVTMKLLKELQSKWDISHTPAQFVLITLDPESDKAESRTAFLRKHNLLRDNWHFLSGSIQEIRAASKILGLADFWKMDDHILHGFRITIYDPDHRVKKVLDWDRQDIVDL